MSDLRARSFSSAEQTALFVLRVLIGWHFLYEGYYKLMLPAWSVDGRPLGPWSSSGYLKSASGPLGGWFRGLADARWVPWIDRVVEVGLVLVGLSLMLGFLTTIGCLGAAALLTLFYLSSVPVSGVPQVGNEGTYLLVNKNLIELAAVLVLFVFRAGKFGGLDMLWKKNRKTEGKGA